VTFELPTCHFCGEPVDPTETGTYRRVTGWIQLRQGGGGHAIRLTSPPESFAHSWCIDRAIRGASLQTEMVL
jgi:hypothetical protein